MDLLMPIIGCALGIVVSIMSIKVVMDKGKNAVMGAVTGKTQQALGGSIGQAAINATNGAIGGMTGTDIGNAPSKRRDYTDYPGLNQSSTNGVVGKSKMGKLGKAGNLALGGAQVTAGIAGGMARVAGKIAKDVGGIKIGETEDGKTKTLGGAIKHHVIKRPTNWIKGKVYTLAGVKDSEQLKNKIGNSKVGKFTKKTISGVSRIGDGVKSVYTSSTQKLSKLAGELNRGIGNVTDKVKNSRVIRGVKKVGDYGKSLSDEFHGEGRSKNLRIKGRKRISKALGRERIRKALEAENPKTGKDHFLGRLHAKKGTMKHKEDEGSDFIDVLKNAGLIDKEDEASDFIDMLKMDGIIDEEDEVSDYIDKLKAAGIIDEGDVEKGKGGLKDRMLVRFHAAKGTAQQLANNAMTALNGMTNEAGAAVVGIGAGNTGGVIMPTYGSDLNGNGVATIPMQGVYGYGYNPEMAGMGIPMNQYQFINNDLTTTTIENPDGSISKVSSTFESNKRYTGITAPIGNNSFIQTSSGQMQGSNIERYESAFRGIIDRYNQEIASRGGEPISIEEGTRISQHAAQQFALLQNTSTEAIRQQAYQEFGIDDKKQEIVERIAEKSPQVQSEINKRVEELMGKYSTGDSSEEDRRQMEEVIREQVKSDVYRDLGNGGSAIGQIYGDDVEKKVRDEVGRLDIQAERFADGEVQEARIREIIEGMNKSGKAGSNSSASEIASEVEQKKMEEFFRASIKELQGQQRREKGLGNPEVPSDSGNSSSVKGREQGQPVTANPANTTPQNEQIRPNGQRYKRSNGNIDTGAGRLDASNARNNSQVK